MESAARQAERRFVFCGIIDHSYYLRLIARTAAQRAPQHHRIDAGEVAHENDEEILEFSVSDSGSGIAADPRATLFQPFMQVDGTDTRQFGGTGLAACRT